MNKFSIKNTWIILFILMSLYACSQNKGKPKSNSSKQKSISKTHQCEIPIELDSINKKQPPMNKNSNLSKAPKNVPIRDSTDFGDSTPHYIYYARPISFNNSPYMWKWKFNNSPSLQAQWLTIIDYKAMPKPCTLNEVSIATIIAKTLKGDTLRLLVPCDTTNYGLKKEIFTTPDGAPFQNLFPNMSDYYLTPNCLSKNINEKKNIGDFFDEEVKNTHYAKIPSTR